ncbi:hypothetical protein T484DRAFT_1764075, partial [Baffinella frigidus]
TISLQPDASTAATLSAAFLVTAFDASISANCSTPAASGVCGGAESGGVQVAVTLMGLPRVIDAEKVYEDVRVLFGGAQAGSVTAGVEGGATVLSVAAPACAACVFEGGGAVVPLLVQIRMAGFETVAQLSFVYFAAPRVTSARFTSSATQLRIAFDQDTDAVPAPAASCAALVQGAGLGAAPTCVWQGATVLLVTLGPGAGIAPGGTMALVAGGIRSANQLSSSAATLPITVAAPALLLPPGPLVVSAPAEVDPCGDLLIKAGAPSPRALRF